MLLHHHDCLALDLHRRVRTEAVEDIRQAREELIPDTFEIEDHTVSPGPVSNLWHLFPSMFNLQSTKWTVGIWWWFMLLCICVMNDIRDRDKSWPNFLGKSQQNGQESLYTEKSYRSKYLLLIMFNPSFIWVEHTRAICRRGGYTMGLHIPWGSGESLRPGSRYSISEPPCWCGFVNTYASYLFWRLFWVLLVSFIINFYLPVQPRHNWGWGRLPWWWWSSIRRTTRDPSQPPQHLHSTRPKRGKSIVEEKRHFAFRTLVPSAPCGIPGDVLPMLVLSGWAPC